RRPDGILRGTWRAVAAALLCTAIVALRASTLQARADPRVLAAGRAAQEGAGDSARAALSRLLDATPREQPLYPEILFATALVSPTAQEMQRNLQRVTVEHPLSPWADDAFLKLAQLEYAGGNLPGTVRQLERIRSDFPQSDVMGIAAFWAARTYFDLRDERAACRWIGAGLAATAPGAADVRSQLDNFARRCPGDMLAAGAIARSVRASADAPAEAPSTAAAAPPVDSAPAPAPTPVDTIRLAPRDTTLPAGPAIPDPTPAVSEPTPAVPDPAAEQAPTEIRAAASGDLVARVAPPTRPAEAPGFGVQVVAAGTQSAADDAVQRLEQLGYGARIYREGGFFKVRAGPYAARADANAARTRLVSHFPGAFVVRN